ncbi:hypothetical protein Arad_8205 [Rhizobium rhizogenes K84]|uniref:Uncharacterized protein n=1 Tax=Rhizobium rhizogenes (strain K84 / ATCC BAA-868) TaxID=311403 RepID=B9JHZ4_RHIR8|nr:hypothetical protein Arad_8205 [Rhizobium rhizogenes K84]
MPIGHDRGSWECTSHKWLLGVLRLLPFALGIHFDALVAAVEDRLSCVFVHGKPAGRKFRLLTSLQSERKRFLKLPIFAKSDEIFFVH